MNRSKPDRTEGEPGPAETEAPEQPAAAPASPEPASSPPGVTRREVLTRLLVAGAAACGATGAALLFHDRRPPLGTVPAGEIHDYRVPEEPAGAELVYTRHKGEGAMAVPEACRALVEALGGMKRFVRPGERVLIKPNVGWERAEQQAANTNPQVVGTLVRLCLEAGAGQVVVTDVSCNDARRSFTRSGIGLAAQQAGAQVILPTYEDFRNVSMGGKVLGEWPVLRALLEADRVINVPIVKHHSLTRMTAGMKNLYGIIGGRRNLLHQHIDQSIFDLAHFARPTLVVVDAVRVLLRNGPQGGSFQDVSEEKQLAATTDPVAADAWAAAFLGLQPQTLGYLRLAQGVLGSWDLSRTREV